MNEKVRTYLIKAARQKEKFVYYSDVVKDCALNIDTTTKDGRNQLSNVLGEVAAYENRQLEPRPLVSALAIYKDKNKNDHGDGFYKIAAKLGKGTFNNLKSDLFGFTEAERSRRFWQNEDNYLKFASIKLPLIPAEIVEFFNKEELDFFKIWQQQNYEADNNIHVQAKDFLMDTVWEKSIYLGKEIIKRLEGFDIEAKKTWSKLGSKVEGKKRVHTAQFKHYTWIKIFRNTDKGRKIYFTFGVDARPDAEAFVYKIDCQRERGSNFSVQQIDLIDSLIPITAWSNKIPFSDLIKENWQSLISICLNFIIAHTKHYDAIIDAVWGEPIPPTLFKNHLVREDIPLNGFDSFPEKEKGFKGIDVDFQAKAKEQKDIGDAGEGLVKIREIEFLKRKELYEKAALVEIVKDGRGFDVLSFDENGQEKFIEVKTTTGNEYSAFYLSENEMDFMRLHPNQYCIYRVYNYDSKNNFGKFFELTNNVEDQILYKPVQFKVLIKKAK